MTLTGEGKGHFQVPHRGRVWRRLVCGIMMHQNRFSGPLVAGKRKTGVGVSNLEDLALHQEPLWLEAFMLGDEDLKFHRGGDDWLEGQNIIGSRDDWLEGQNIIGSEAKAFIHNIGITSPFIQSLQQRLETMAGMMYFAQLNPRMPSTYQTSFSIDDSDVGKSSEVVSSPTREDLDDGNSTVEEKIFSPGRERDLSKR